MENPHPNVAETKNHTHLPASASTRALIRGLSAGIVSLPQSHDCARISDVGSVPFWPGPTSCAGAPELHLLNMVSKPGAADVRPRCRLARPEKSVALIEATLEQGGPAILQFARLADALAAHKRLTAAMAH